MNSKIYFISGIDTDCGKTYVCGILAKAFLAKGKKIITQKMVQTGCKRYSDDIIEHRKMMGIQMLEDDISGLTCSYVFNFPASPHLAAKLENKIIDLNTIKESTNKLLNKYEIVLLEGAGGLLVPINEKTTTADYIKANNYPLILVVSSKLGSINHSLLSIEYCKTNNIDLEFIIYNTLPNSNSIISSDSYNIISKYAKKLFTKINIIKCENIHEKIDLF